MKSLKSALTAETIYDIAKYGPERGKLALEYLCGSRFCCVFRVDWSQQKWA